MGRELARRLGFFSVLDIKEMKRITAEAIARYGYKLDVDREVESLSGDERQIIAVTRAVEFRPKLLLLDEAFTMLSVDGRAEVIKFLKEVNKQSCISMIVVSHDLDLVKELSHYIMVLRTGEKVFFGKNEDISVDEIIEYMLP
jgi:ABC-type sugar transport system ATPase subunit